MTYTIKFVNFTLGAPLQKSRLLTEVGVCALPALYGSYAHVAYSSYPEYDDAEFAIGVDCDRACEPCMDASDNHLETTAATPPPCWSYAAATTVTTSQRPSTSYLGKT